MEQTMTNVCVFWTLKVITMQYVSKIRPVNTQL